MLDKKFFLKEGANTRDDYRDHIFRKALDVHGNKFKQYKSKKYQNKKAAGGFKTQNRGYPLFAPVLTGDLLNDYSLIETSNNGFIIGWNIQGAKVGWLKDNKRELTTSKQPLPEKILKKLFAKAKLYIKKEKRKIIPRKTTRHKIGK
tara:strand:+ start:1048 stop:1488 length:441 start_codon:yes stop_codon:yes gene_type:complete